IAVTGALASCTGGSPREGPPVHAATSASSVAPCNKATISGAAKGLFRAWNEQDAAALAKVLTPDVLGDISRKDQGANRANGGYEILSGLRRVIAFVKKQWALGETLSYTRVKAVSAATGGSPGGYL